MKRLLIIGCGDVARRALPWLTRRYRVYAAVRGEEGSNQLRRLDVTPLLVDLDQPKSLARLAGVGDLILHFAPPPDRGTRDTRTRRLLAALAAARILPQRIVYISTSGVYGDCCGERIDEARPLDPQTPRARRRVDAEQVLRRFGVRLRVTVSLLRAPGIYADDRLPLGRLRRGDPVLRPEDDVYTNHIHADDLAHIACMALSRGRPGRAYNASDDSELHMGDYFDFVADAFGIARPPRLSRGEAAVRLSPLTLSFMEESRRLCNRRLREELRVSLRYPTVLSGIAAACEVLNRESR